ncbi:MAG: carboxypeptidase regulatory-like domain-containing protein [Candidatus Bathyarchaeia archaeon]
MKGKLNIKIVGFLIAATMLMAFMPNLAYASRGLELETSCEWLTGDASYSMASTIGDVDGDGATEIVTAGYFYNSTLGVYEGEVDIWHWNGTNLVEEHKEIIEPAYMWSSDTRFYSVALGNVDNTTNTEIVVVGYGKFFGTLVHSLLIVLSWNGTVMERKTGWYWPDEAGESKFFDVAIGDVDKDGTAEIIAVGYWNTTSFGTGFHGALTIWNVTGTTLKLETSFEWMVSGDAEWHAVALDDVDGDGDTEIIVTGYFYDKNLGHECAMLRICTWDGSTLNWEAGNQWYTYQDTYALNVAVSDVDADGNKEIVTIGRHFNGETYYAQLRIWSWDGYTLALRLSAESGAVGMFMSSSGKKLAINDIDGDGKNEIVIGIDISVFLFSTPIIRVLSWDGKILTTKESKEWGNATNIEDVSIGDVDADGTIEIVTIGYAWAFMMPTPTQSELAIWSVSKVASSITVSVSPSSMVIGSHVIISGRITDETGDNPIPNAEVTIEFSREPLPVLVIIGKAITNENGEYTFTWIPGAVGNYLIRATWKGDYEHEGAAATTTLTVEKAPSLITLTLSSYIAKVGDSISVSGVLYPAKTAAITLHYTKPDSSTSTSTVYSNQNGVFTDTFTVDQVGEWQIKASWSGDEQYKAAESAPAPLTVTKIQSTLSITASQLTVNVGEEITINGALTPGQTANIILTYTMPNGTSTTKTVQSTSTGTFTYTIKLDKAGTWQVKASWAGDAQHTAAESTSITLTAQAADLTAPMFALGGLGLGIIALVLAVVALLMYSKKPKTAPPPPAQPTQPS